MELKSFAGDEFDTKKWINKAWNSSSNQEKELFVANTVSRLQLYMKQLTNSLDETTSQIVTSIPRILQDASQLQIEGALLQEQLNSLQSKVEGVEEETGQSIKSLQKIDQLKSRLENAASSLREADKWAALSTSLEDILEAGVPTEAGKLGELAQLVSAMTASLEVLSDAPDYETKRVQLETLFNRLEAAISGPLIEAITLLDAEKTSTYVRVLSGMARLVSCRRCWRRAAAARLAARWARLPQHSLHKLTTMLADDAAKEVDWLTTVLHSDQPVSDLIRLYTDLLLSLEPSPTKIVSANLKLCSTPEEGITLLSDLRQDIDEFVACIRVVMDAPKQSQEAILPATIKELGKAVYAPLRDLLPQYTELQTQILLSYLNDPLLKQDDLLEQSRALHSVSERCSNWLGTAYGKAKSIAGMAAFTYYAPAVETFVTALTSHISSHSRRIESAFLSSIKAGQTTGVLSSAFPAFLVLGSAASLLLDVLTERQAVEMGDDEQPTHPLLNLPKFLEQESNRPREPSAAMSTLRRTKDQLRGLARAVLRHPVDVQLEKIPLLAVWSNNDALSTDLPDFALSPQEYITEIGQYLMTLPQHLEMHVSDKHAPWQFLAEVCTHTCELYAEKILNIRNMDALGTKRCLTDIVYLSSVVEDLGGIVSQSLRNLETTLRAATPASDDL